MYGNYYDMPTPEEELVPRPEGPEGDSPPPEPEQDPVSPPPADQVDAWSGGSTPAPIYEDTAPLPGGGDRPPKARKGIRGTVIFCAAVAVIAAGIIALVVKSGLNPTLELPERPNIPSFGYDFDLPTFSDGRKETTIERYPAGNGPTMTLEALPESGALTYQQVYDKVLPSIVGVRAYSGSGTATGTGVVLSGDGYIITNFHVIEGADSAQVVLMDDTVYDALLVGGDSANDLAVLKIDGEGLTPAEFGDSDLLQVGDEALAIGNPLGEQLKGTMTNGIVSAINRDVNTDGITMTLIQTTAALNSGNSGGALVNICGQVVGITNMKMSNTYLYGTATIEGLGFAIPSVTVKAVADELIDQGHVGGRPTLGITVQLLPEEDWEDYGVPEDFRGGILVTKVEKGSGAETGGVKVGDIIVEADGFPIRMNSDLVMVKNDLDVGDVLEMKVWRGGEYRTVSVELIEQYELDHIR